MPATFRLTAVGLLLTASFAVAQDAAKDQFGDPLPAGAVARLGSTKFRDLGHEWQPFLHPDGKRLVVNVNGTPTVHDLATGEAAGKLGNIGRRRPYRMTADGKRMLGGLKDGFEMWDAASGELKLVYRPSGDPDVPVASPSMTADGKLLGLAGVTPYKSLEVARPMLGPTAAAAAMGSLKDGVNVTLWSADENKAVAKLQVAQNLSAWLVLSANGKRAVSGGEHKRVSPDAPDEGKRFQFWDVDARKEVASARLPDDFARRTWAYSATGDRLAVAGDTGRILIYDAATGQLQRELTGVKVAVTWCTFSPDGKTLAAFTADTTVQMFSVQLFDAATGRSLGVTNSPVFANYSFITGVAFTSPDRLVVLTSNFSTVCAWEAPSGKVISPGGGVLDPPSGVAFTPDGKRVLSIVRARVIAWNLTGGIVQETDLSSPDGRPKPVGGDTLIAAGGRLAVRHYAGGRPLIAEDIGTLSLYDLPSGAQRLRLKTDRLSVRAAGFSADGSVMAYPKFSPIDGDPDRFDLVVIDTKTGKTSAAFKLGPGSPGAPVVSPDGKLVSIWRSHRPDPKKKDMKSYLNTFDLATGKMTGEVEFPQSINFVRTAVSPDGKSLLSTKSEPPGLAVFDLTTGKEVRSFGDPQHSQTCSPAISPDGKLVAMCCVSANRPLLYEVRVFDWETGKLKRATPAHKQPVNTLAFSPDGKLLASCSDDSTILLWDVSK